MSQNIEGDRCPICSSTAVTAFFRRERVPIHQNIVISEQEAAHYTNRGDLHLVVCEECGFVFNRTFDLSKLSYNEAYDNTQTHSPFFNKYVEQLAHYLVFERGVRDCRIVEVGCGKGLFLRSLVQVDESGNSGYGFDPAYVGPAVDLGGRLRFEKRFYGPECADVPADVVVCRHVIEHVPDPVELLISVRRALVGSPRARLFFETPCVKWILEHRVIWDFFYEHCSYFTAESLTTAFEVAGFKVEDVQHVFGQQYLWLEATLAEGITNTDVSKNPGVIPSLSRGFAHVEHDLKMKWSDTICELASRQTVALWGAGAKGVTLANLVDPERQWIRCVVDLNPHKQGHYLAGTGHPIIGCQALAAYGITAVILMNPNYRDEILKLLDTLQLKVDLIELGA